MMSRWIAIGALAAAACTEPSGEVTGPYTGPVTRYAIDSIMIPSTRAQIQQVSGDIGGLDLRPDNQVGEVTRSLDEYGDLTRAGRDMIASGVIRSYFEIQADDLSNDDTVSVAYIGGDGEDFVAVGARLVNGSLLSNRTRSSVHLGRARLHLPIFVDADPVDVVLEGLEIDLAPDLRGGYEGIVRGGIGQAALDEAVYTGVVAMFSADPSAHKVFRQLLEGAPGVVGDGVITRAEVIENSLIMSLLAPDLDLPEIGKAVSFGFGIHLAPCRDGVCPSPTVVDRCQDRVRDGDETDLDCGGSCLPCAAARACAAPSDCQSGTCAAGSCTAPTCGDGVENGFESDVDCGGVCATKCQRGLRCELPSDCASGTCNATCE